MKHRIHIVKINWLDEDIKEAVVEFIVNDKKIYAFCHPCNYLESEDVEVEWRLQ